ncbi:SIMPL domain-containing protein [Streptomyces antibioticus]|uniref:SIMPL domain-containing protein n=1 Tax=Streptomyces antibioticus TaxID=1890 RepID=UPI0033B52C1B
MRPTRTPVAAALVTLLALGLPAVTVPVAAASPARPAAARVDPAPATITVTGEGSATAPPDVAVVAVAVEATGATSQAALDAQNTAAGALLTAVRAQGVAERDVRTDTISLQPVYDTEGGSTRLKGYQAAQSFSVKVREVERTGAVLQSITDATGDAGRINAVAFEVSDPVPLQARAREAAHDDARAKAEQLARLSGHELGRLVSLSEDSAGYPRPTAQFADAAGAAVPTAPGEIRATATVTAVYEVS